MLVEMTNLANRKIVMTAIKKILRHIFSPPRRFLAHLRQIDQHPVVILPESQSRKLGGVFNCRGRF